MTLHIEVSGIHKIHTLHLRIILDTVFWIRILESFMVANQMVE